MERYEVVVFWGTSLRPRLPGADLSPYCGAVQGLSRVQLLEQIWIAPGRGGGRPCIRGYRLWLSLILDLLAFGSWPNEILAMYPVIEPANIQACRGNLRKNASS